MSKQKGGLLGMLIFLVGIIFGGLAALLFSTDEKGETKKAVKDKVKTIKTKLHDVYEAERIKDIYGRASTEATKAYQEAKELLASKLAELKEAYDQMDKEKYKAVVNEVGKTLKNEAAMTSAQLKKLSGYFMEDFSKLKSKDVEQKIARGKAKRKQLNG